MICNKKAVFHTEAAFFYTCRSGFIDLNQKILIDINAQNVPKMESKISYQKTLINYRNFS